MLGRRGNGRRGNVVVDGNVKTVPIAPIAEESEVEPEAFPGGGDIFLPSTPSSLMAPLPDGLGPEAVAGVDSPWADRPSLAERLKAVVEVLADRRTANKARISQLAGLATLVRGVDPTAVVSFFEDGSLWACLRHQALHREKLVRLCSLRTLR